jgi:hypothetical protein
MAFSAGLKAGTAGFWTVQDPGQKIANTARSRSAHGSIAVPLSLCSTSGLSSADSLSDPKWVEKHTCHRGSRKRSWCQEAVSAILAQPKNAEDTEGWRQRSELSFLGSQTTLGCVLWS